MNNVIAENIRIEREKRSWTQEHLAQAAQVTTRTIQRAEQGNGVSADSLLAIAGAFDVEIEALRFDPVAMLATACGVPRDELTDEVIARKLDEAKKRFEAVPLTEITASGHLELVYGADALHFDCIPEDDSIRDASAELRQFLADLSDLKHDIEPTQRRAYAKDAFEIVERLRKLGAAVAVGSHERRLRMGEQPSLVFTFLYVIVSSVNDVKSVAMVDKTAPVRFR